jgi:hypothetical protein
MNTNADFPEWLLQYEIKLCDVCDEFVANNWGKEIRQFSFGDFCIFYDPWYIENNKEEFSWSFAYCYYNRDNEFKVEFSGNGKTFEESISSAKSKFDMRMNQMKLIEKTFNDFCSRL